VVDPTRPAAVRSLLQQFDVDIVLSDDGLQHYALGRDLEIAILDGERRIGNGFCLPAGPLREPVSRLKSVDFVLIRGGDDPADRVVYEPDCLVNIATGEQRPLGPLSPGEPVYALAGIGQPQQFFESLRRAGFELQTRVFADHHNYRSGDFADLADKPILMTEKDAVKCAEFAGQNAWYLRINARLPETLLEAVAALAQH
jgi:tetraacyldisaccharide 4'-kinase